MEEYKREHLFLLIGTNPLPNYIAAKLMLKDNGKLHLIYSRGVDEAANNLLKTLGLDQEKDRYKKVLIDESAAWDIYEKVNNEAKGKTSLALHYTGGTKAMAVHAYRAVIDANPDAVFSYLDARKLEMVIDRPCSDSKRFSVNLSVKPTIEELLSLHGYSLRKIEDKPEHVELSQVIRTIPAKEYRKWCNGNLRNGGNLCKSSELKKVELPAGGLFDILQPFWGDSKNLKELNAIWGRSPGDIEKTAKWLDGVWLEDYVLDSILQIKDQANVHQVAKSIEPLKNGSKRDFEFDVAAMRGYQLFALSCTTGSRKAELKRKLFELLIRASQMGGDEARAALVCCAPPQKAPLGSDNNTIQYHTNNCPEKILQEVEESWDVKGKIKIFGEEHLENLQENLLQWFEMH